MGISPELWRDDGREIIFNRFTNGFPFFCRRVDVVWLVGSKNSLIGKNLMDVAGVPSIGFTGRFYAISPRLNSLLVENFGNSSFSEAINGHLENPFDEFPSPFDDNPCFGWS